MADLNVSGSVIATQNVQAGLSVFANENIGLNGTVFAGDSVIASANLQAGNNLFASVDAVAGRNVSSTGLPAAIAGTLTPLTVNLVTPTTTPTTQPGLLLTDAAGAKYVLYVELVADVPELFLTPVVGM
ncbi:hypothetical protein JZ785_26895 [Alicyclobacillus curvatus]|nr:hypothetical protein JZ785_26895 [Alicyclobacillus curvatus]